jgi:SRSO17 transposase
MTSPTGDAKCPFDYLNDLHSYIQPRFARTEPRERALTYLRGILSPVPRRTGWQLAAQSGEKYPDGMQRLLNSARWNADQVRDDIRDFVLGYAADREAVLIVNKWRFHKKGSRSAGVHHERSNHSRRTTNVQQGTFLTYVSDSGRFLIDRELFLPQVWAKDPSRRTTARVPDDVTYRTTSELGASMVARAFVARTPARWVAATAEYGADQQLRKFLERNQVWFVLGVRAGETLPTLSHGRVRERTAGTAAALVPADAWTPEPKQPGPAGPRYQWARLPVPSPQPSKLVRWLLLRRNPAIDGELRYYLCGTTPAVPLSELAKVATLAEQNGEVLASACKNAGLDEYEVRHWTGWYRYTTLSLAAYNCLALAGDPDTWGPSIPEQPTGRAGPQRPRPRAVPAHSAHFREHHTPRTTHRPPDPEEEQPCQTTKPHHPSARCKPCATKCVNTSSSSGSMAPPGPRKYHWTACRSARLAESGR